MENMGPLLNHVRDLALQGRDKAEVLNTFFASVFTSKSSLLGSQALETRGKG